MSDNIEKLMQQNNDMSEKLADMLGVGEGVVQSVVFESPVNIKQPIYLPIGNETVAEYIVDSIDFDCTGSYITAHLGCYENDYPQSFDLKDFGKTFFLTPIEARNHANNEVLNKNCEDCTYYWFNEKTKVNYCGRGGEKQNECIKNNNKYLDYHN